MRALPPSLRDVGLSLLVHGGVAAVLCGEAIASGGRRVVGAASTETWVFLWGHAWLRHALLEEGRWPYQTTWANFPDGGVLWLKDPLGSLLMLPVQLLVGIPAAATAWAWLLYTLAGLCTALLLRRLGAGTLAAILGGLLYQVHPHALGEAYNANIEALLTFTLPLWLLGLVAVARRPDPPRVLAAAAALWVLLACNQYWAVAMVPVSAVALALLLVEGRAPLARALGATLAATALGGLGFLPLARAITASMASRQPLNELPVGQRVELVPPYLIDAWGLVQARARVGWPDVPFLDLVYPGWLAVGLALLAPLLLRRASAALPLLGGLGFLLLSLGPALAWRGSLRTGPVLPWAWLTGLPGLSGMSLPARMAVPAALGFAVGAGLALAVVVRWRPRGLPAGVALAVLLGGGAAAEMVDAAGLSWTLPTVAVPAPAHAFLLREARVEGAVLDLPLNRGSNDLRVALWYQAIHRRPVQASLRFARPALADRQPLVGLLWRLDGPEIDAEAVAAAGLAGELRPEGLAEEGYAYVVLHDRLMEDMGRPIAAFATVLEATLGPGVVAPDGLARIWPTTPAARAALEEARAALDAE